jgi:hypothetical protein
MTMEQLAVFVIVAVNPASLYTVVTVFGRGDGSVASTTRVAVTVTLAPGAREAGKFDARSPSSVSFTL